MRLNPDHSKQAPAAIFLNEINKPNNPKLIFDKIKTIKTPYQQHFGKFL